MMSDYSRYKEEREKLDHGEDVFFILPLAEIPRCPARVAQKAYLEGSGWWLLCADCQRWFGGSLGQMTAHTTDGYEIYGGCAVSCGPAGSSGLIGRQRGQLASEVNGPEDADLLKHGSGAVTGIVNAVNENRLRPIHQEMLERALAYIQRVNLDNDDAGIVRQAAECLGT